MGHCNGDFPSARPPVPGLELGALHVELQEVDAPVGELRGEVVQAARLDAVPGGLGRSEACGNTQSGTRRVKSDLKSNMIRFA